MRFVSSVLRSCPLSLLLLGTLAAAPRITPALDAGWTFSRGEFLGAAALQFDEAGWSRVTLPHTFNAESDPPPKDYYRGPGWYRHELKLDPAWKGRRVFVRFGAASLVAKVYLNGVELGEHRGGFAAFCYELTPGLNWQGRNILSVRVDNSRREDVIPLGGDFTVYGGLYRDVSLLVTDTVAITPLDHGSPGIFLHQREVTADHADLDIVTEVSNGTSAAVAAEVRISVRDAKGTTVAHEVAATNVAAGATQPITKALHLEQPHRWNGVADPYLYTTRVEVAVAGKVVDILEQPLGLRSIAMDPARGFILNGQPQQIRGVDRHQDWAGVGWAISREQQDTDMRIIREMGATGVRLAHYQHADYFYSLCDREGLLVWAELPMVNDVRGGAAFRDNAAEQLTELVRQNENHPAIVMWSLYNEIGVKNPVDPVPIVAGLKEIANAEDPSRPTTGALSIDGIAKLPHVGELNNILALNVYPGWYVDTAADMGAIVDRWNASYGSHGIIISEYGAGASIDQHQQDFTGRTGRAPKAWHPEEWQSIVHEQNYADMKARPFVYGSFVWNMFDFASAGRSEGDTPGINDKGLVTRDRKVKKDAFFFYQANWTTTPMIYITSRRDHERTTPLTPVKVYSNCARVRLRVNGRDLGEATGSELHVFQWKDVALQPGDNRIEVEATSAKGVIRDTCEWHLGAAKS